MSISMLVVPTRSFRYVLHDEHTEPIDTKKQPNNQSVLKTQLSRGSILLLWISFSYVPRNTVRLSPPRPVPWPGRHPFFKLFKSCSCAKKYLCHHNKTASFNTRRPKKEVIHFRKNAKRLRHGGRLEESAVRFFGRLQYYYVYALAIG